MCSADMISGWFQLPNTVPHHHPLCTGTEVGGGVGRGQALCPLPTPMALLLRLALEWSVLTG